MTQNNHLLTYTKEGKTIIRIFSFLVTPFLLCFCVTNVTFLTPVGFFSKTINARKL